MTNVSHCDISSCRKTDYLYVYQHAAGPVQNVTFITADALQNVTVVTAGLLQNVTFVICGPLQNVTFVIVQNVTFITAGLKKNPKTSFLTFSSYLIHFYTQLSIMSFVHLLVSRPLPGSPNKEVDKRHFSSIVMPRMLCPLIICMAASGAYIIVLFVCDLFQ